MREIEREILKLYLPESYHHWLGNEAENIEPYCDGDFTEEECIESDGFITCYFSGPIRPIQD